MASQQLLRTLDALMLLLLLACCSTDASMLRRLFSTQLQDSSATATSRDSSHAKAGARELHSTASSATDLSRHLMDVSSSPPSPLPAAPPWELELAPYMADLFPPRNPNSTLLRGPPRLAGVFKGSWIRTAYGDSLRPQDTLSSERGVIILRFPADQNSAGSGASMYDSRGGGGSAGGGSQRQLIPGGLQGLEGELVIRNGDSITDRDLRFRLRGTFVAAAGTVHAVLEPQLPLVLKEEVENGGGGAGGGDDWRQQQQQQHQAGLAVTKVAAAGGEGKAGPAAAVMAAAGGGGGGGGSAAAAAAAAGARGSGGGAQSSSGYREALRTAARNLVILGPAWHRTLVRHQPPAPPSPPPPHGSGGGGQRRQAVAEGESSPPSPPRPPLELALLQACELRADFRVYYKGDPDATSHVQFLRLDEPPSPPRQLKPSAAAGVTSGVDGDVNPAAATVVRQLRHLTADTEIYHSTQMQLHADATASAVAGGGGGGGGGGAAPAGAAVPAEDVVYGIPPGMDPMDPDLELVGVVMSPNCEFAVHFNASSVHLERYYRQAVRYSVLVAAVTIAQILLSVSQAEAASTPSAAARMSLYSVTMQAILDAYQCLLHLTGALVVDALFAAFASIAFLQFLLFAVFEMRQTLLVFRAQRTNGTGDGGDFWSVRRAMSAVYFRFYGLLLLGLLFMFQFRSQLALLVLVLHSWWVPQLVYSATSDTRPPYMAGYVWGMSALRLVSPIYFYGCPSNLLRVHTHPELCVALVLWVGLQAALVSAQMKMGPRVFVPRAFLPRRYDYHRPATTREMGIEESPPQAPSAAATATSLSSSSSSSPPPSASASSASASASSYSAATATTLGSGGWWWGWVATWGSGGPLLRRLTTSWISFATAATTSWRLRRPAVLFSSLYRTATAAGGAGGGRRSCVAVDGDGDVETGHGSKECVICMNPVPLLPYNARMLTPCGHFFHEPCLTRWMEVKMDCPTCRRPLPPV